MPILGLTDRGAQFPRIGELRKGAPKPKTGNKPGADLKHFRFTSTNESVVKTFADAFGNEPNEIRVFLPYQTNEENFESWIEEWGAGSLKWRGDGKTLHVWQTDFGTYSHEPKPQPEKGGKQVGRLKVIIPELGRLAYVVALTTSIHDIMELSANLTAYEAMAGGLQGIPFILSRVPRMVSTPSKKGRVRREKWLLHIEAAPEWVAAQLSVMQHAALPGATNDALMIESGEPDFEADEDGVIIEHEDNGVFSDVVQEIIDEPKAEIKETKGHDMTPPNAETVIMWRGKIESQHRLKMITLAGMVSNAVPYFDGDWHVMNYTEFEKDSVFMENEIALAEFDRLVAIGAEKANA